MSRRELFVRLAGLSIGVAILAIVVRYADVAGALPLVAGIGPVVVLGLVPYLAQIGLDARAWQGLLAATDQRASWRRLLASRLATEGPTFPGRWHVPLAQLRASAAIKYALLALAQSAFLLIAFLVGSTTLADHSQAIVGSPALPFLVAVGAVGMLIAAWNRARSALATLTSQLSGTPDAFRRIVDSPGAVAGATVLLVLALLVATFEAWLLCHLVGIDISITHALAMQAAVVLARNVACFVPAGLGVQDAGYLAFLAAFAIAAPQATAFVLLVRCKELVWRGAGYVLLLAIERRRPSFVALGGVP